MAQVPIYDDFKVKLDPLRPVMQKTPDVSSGLQALAKGMGDAADSWDRIEYRQAQSDAFKAQADIGEQWAKTDIELRNKYRGDNAQGYAEESAKWWKEKQDTLSASLSPRARALASKGLGQMRLSATTNGLAYVEREKENAAEVNYNTAQSVITNQAGTTLPLDAAIKQVTDNAVQRFAVLGFGEAAAKEHARKYVTDAIANNVTRQLDNPTVARATLEKYRDRMDNDAYTRLNEAVKTSETRAAGIALGKAIAQGSGPAGTDFESSFQFTLKTEGGYTSNDAGKGETNYGINKTANPDIDIKNLTPDRAREIYKQRYWNAIGADSLPPAVRAIAFDAAVNQGVSFANKIIAEADGDPAKMLDLRRQKYQALVKANPEKYGRYARSWENRLRALEPRTGKPSVSDMIAQARAHADPEVANIAERTVREEVSLSELRQREAYAANLGAAWAARGQGPAGWRSIPDPIMAQLTPEDRVKVMDGPPTGTDYKAWGDAREAILAGQYVDLGAYRDRLSPSDFAGLQKLQKEATTNKDKLAEVKMDKDTSDQILHKMGFPVYGKMDESQKEMSAEVRYKLERALSKAQQTKGRPLTNDEMLAIGADLAVRTVTVYRPFLPNRNMPVLSVTQEDLDNVVIPKEQQEAIRNELRNLYAVNRNPRYAPTWENMRWLYVAKQTEYKVSPK